MLVIFATLFVGLAVLGPLLMRYAARDASAQNTAHDESATPLAEPWRWLVRCPVALFAGFIVTGLMNEALGSVALWLGRKVELDRAGQAVALWPPTAIGQVAELLFFGALALVVAVQVDRRLLMRGAAAPAPAMRCADRAAADDLPAPCPPGPAAGRERPVPTASRLPGTRPKRRGRSTRR